MQSREFGLALPCVASVSVRFQNKEPGTRVKDRAKKGRVIQHFFALVRFFARPKPKISFLGLLCSEIKRKRLLCGRAGPGPGQENLRTMGANSQPHDELGRGRGRAAKRRVVIQWERNIFYLCIYFTTPARFPPPADQKHPLWTRIEKIQTE